MSGVSKKQLLDKLPYSYQDFTIRVCRREDYDRLVSWPPYQWPFDGFNLSFASFDKQELDQLYDRRQQETGRVTLVADFGETKAVGYIALLEIDWEKRWAYNMSVRVHPEHLGRGNGTTMLETIRDWWFNNAMKGLRLDVAASNPRAVRSYEKAGFRVVDEFWREAPDLVDADLSDPRYGFLWEHVDLSGGIPRIRFYLMESSQG